MNELTLKEVQDVSLEALVYFADFCERKHLNYFLAYGTLIGSIRHNGFIPWDDDIDLIMPRPDYERLLDQFESTAKFKLITCFNDKKYVLPYAKIMHLDTAAGVPDKGISSGGVGIDIFPLEGLSDDKRKAEKQFKSHNWWFKNILNRLIRYEQFSQYEKKKIVKRFVGRASYKVGFTNSLARRLALNPSNYSYDQSKHVGCIIGLYTTGFQYFDKEDFLPLKDGIFENRQFYIPAGYDRILRRTYGDYMLLPPVEKRISTHRSSIVWRKDPQ